MWRSKRFSDVFALLLLLAGIGCAGLIPATVTYRVHMDPLLPEGRGDYYVDPEDSSVVFSKEGVLIAIRHLTDDELNEQYPPLYDGRRVNPYTHDERDREKRYVPPRFTVFQVTITNKAYAKVEFDPAKAVLTTDRGEEFRYYDAGREGANPLGGNTFTKYYKTELGISGYDKELNLERMGIVYKTVYHRRRPVFKDSQRSGKLVFDPLAEDTREIVLRLNEFVLSFDASGNPERTIDIEYRFRVEQGVLEPAAGQ